MSIMLTRIQLGLAVLFCLSLPVAADDAKLPGTAAPGLTYVRMYVDSEGQSHFDEGQLDFEFQDYAPPAEPIAIHPLANVSGATLLRMAGNSFENWHPAPRRQFAFILQGTVEVTVGDGEVRRFEPGDVVLLEDTAGPGHTTRIIGDTDHLGLMVPVDPD
jgi:hypothetical protein